MFDITGDDVTRLGDADLRTPVARLARAELSVQGLPLSAVTAGGDQDAPDGGIDVRVALERPLTAPDFVPRSKTGFQVKKSDMPASKIAQEMRDNSGTLKGAIGALADAGGAYIIVSAQSSVTDKMWNDRRQAMRTALAENPRAAQLFTDFYDRERLATWGNCYPGVAIWVRARCDRILSGWQPIGRWSDTATAVDRGYLMSSQACIVDERSHDVGKL